MRGRRRFAVLGLGLVIGLTIASAGTAVAAKPAQNAHQRTLAYWTASRIAHAKPRDFLRAPNGGFEKAPHQDAKPPRPGGGGGNVIGASWTKGGQIQVKSGKVVFTLNSGDYICSGTVVNDNQASVSIVLTAGHCAYDGPTAGSPRNWMFIPNFDGAPDLHVREHDLRLLDGAGSGRRLRLRHGRRFNTQATKHDWSFAVVPARRQVECPARRDGRLAPDLVLDGARHHVYAFGYPAAGKYHGSDLTYCKGRRS